MAMIISGLVLLPLIIGALLFTIHFQKRKLFAVYPRPPFTAHSENSQA
jgi:succinate dehydrogenase hydrophobic anchor subunit